MLATLNVSTPVTLARLAAVRAVPDAVIVKVSPVPVPPVKVSLLSKLASVDVTVTAAADAEAFTVSLPELRATVNALVRPAATVTEALAVPSVTVAIPASSDSPARVRVMVLLP